MLDDKNAGHCDLAVVETLKGFSVSRYIYYFEFPNHGTLVKWICLNKNIILVTFLKTFLATGFFINMSIFILNSVCVYVVSMCYILKLWRKLKTKYSGKKSWSS